jgi:hypothetical protein
MRSGGRYVKDRSRYRMITSRNLFEPRLPLPRGDQTIVELQQSGCTPLIMSKIAWTCFVHPLKLRSTGLQARCSKLPAHRIPSQYIPSQSRQYATHRSHPKPSEDPMSNKATASSSAASMLNSQGRVGPFPLGVGPSGRSKTWKRWRELGIGGKCELL